MYITRRKLLKCSILLIALVTLASYVIEWRVIFEAESVPYIYVITPTKARLEQKADLTRLANTLRNVYKVHWIVIEDSYRKTSPVANVLTNCTIPYTHLVMKTPEELEHARPKGVPQRNVAIEWLRQNATKPGVVYFADDDNAYDLRIFEEMRYTKKVSVWPVGLVAGIRYESPVVRNGKVVGWFSYYRPDRMFATDMAGFAVNLELITNKSDAMFQMDRNELESTFIKSLGISLDDLEPKADNCSKVLV